MSPGDRLVYYSPTDTLGTKTPVKAFTAIGTVADDEIWQADEGDFRPWRRRVDYDKNAVEVPVAQLVDVLDLTSRPNWGYQLRRGLLELSERDARIIGQAMGVAP